ncbi:MAG TPA: acetamidase/formamidase family protein [Mycobacteriales bacterium]|nr:acetamidase/formamidase family protein [Mycobacteriales bacterium]
MLAEGVGRRTLLRAAAGLATVGATGLALPATARAAEPADLRILQPGVGPLRGSYLPSRPGQVYWGKLPNRSSEPILSLASGGVVTIDTVSHEGVLEDQGRDPREYFGGFGVPESKVLRDAVRVAEDAVHDGPGPHVVTGPVAVRGAQPGDVLKVEVLDLRLRVPYGVISNRHGKGALPGEYPEAWEDVPRLQKYFNEGGNVSVFTPVAQDAGGLRGQLPGVRNGFPLAPFMGLMGVARDTRELVDSVPPTVTGGNIDINDLGVGSTLWLPVQVAGAKFFTGDPHMAQGDGEVALTAMEGSLRATFRLTVVKPGGAAPSVAFDGYAFGETASHWLPIGLSDPDGPVDGQFTSLDLAMKAAVRNAMAFLTRDLGMDAPVAYAYLSAAADFQVSQVVDRTTGVHALVRKADFR